VLLFAVAQILLQSVGSGIGQHLVDRADAHFDARVTLAQELYGIGFDHFISPFLF
jgi:hypothetical protein